MPFRLVAPDGTPRAKVQFTTFARMPWLIYQACVKTGIVSNTVYLQRAVCEALARDLDMDFDELIEECPPPRSKAKHLWHGDEERFPVHLGGPSGGVHRIGAGNTNEEVR